MLPASQTESRPRKRIGRYLVTARIGRGGMGMVYRAYDEALEREVAVKTLTAEGVVDEESRRRFEIEAKAAARLQHPNIVTVYELGEDRGIQFIAMELLPGLDLDALLRSGERLLLREKLETLVQVCRGLAYAHERGIVHRDIKPSNIRLLEDGTAKIMDFGIAKLGGTGVTRAGMMVGTVQYMSPEQVRGRPLDGRSDLFSVGVILHEMLSGSRPFGGGNATEILYKIVHEAPPPLPDQGTLGAELQGLVDRLLHKDPAQRLPGAAAAAEELQRLLAEHLRANPPRPATGTPEALATARRLLREGRTEECLRELQEATRLDPDAVEVRRVVRLASREARRLREAPPEDDGFPELESTMLPAATRRTPETEVQPPPVAAPPPPPPRASTAPLLFLGAAGLLLAVAAGAGVILLSRAGSDGAPGPSPAPAAATAAPATAPPTRVRLAVSSEPRGATVTLDGAAVPGRTPLDLELSPATAHRLVVSLEGHESEERVIEAGNVPGEVRAVLKPLGPPGQVAVRSGYPVDVVWNGKTLGRGLSPRVSLPPGRHSLALLAPSHGLRRTYTVEVRGGGETVLTAPGLGKLNIRANPDNCEVFLDGVFLDYPPILDRAVVLGSHAVSFKWQDGERREYTVEVSEEKPAYVTGRRD